MPSPLPARPVALQLGLVVPMSGMLRHYVSLVSDASGTPVLATIPDLASSSPSPDGEELLIEARGVTDVDVYTGLALRATIEQHLREDQAASACPWLPRELECRRRLQNLIGPLPARCRLPDDHQHTDEDPRVLVHTTSVEDREAAGLVARHILATASGANRGRLRLGRPEAYFLGESAVVLLDNALRHQGEAPSAPLVACAMKPGSRDTQVAVFDFGTDVSHCDDPLAHLRSCIAATEENPGGLAGLISIAKRRQLDLEIELCSGSALARWRGEWQFESVAFSPGWATGISVQFR